MKSTRFGILRGLLLALVALAAVPAQAATGCAWPDWLAFKQAMLSKDGRVVDANTPRLHTVSEGQAYALFFALAAGDKPAFARILEWTENNLAQGDLTAHLPAWQWGRLDNGQWGVIDSNAASDADLWIAYALGEAGRLWNQRSYRTLSALIANRVLREETANIPGLGLTLLPGPVGFAPAKGRWRLNPSYVPPQLMRWLVKNDPAPAWKSLQRSSIKLIHDPATQGYSPDWVVYQAGKGFLPDEETKASSGYNSIRVYLWAGMLDAADPDRAALLARLKPMAARTIAQGAPPESVDTRDGKPGSDGPPGFSGAMLPMLQAMGEHEAMQVQLKRSRQPSYGDKPAYYDGVLNLFGRGYIEKRFRFAADGSLEGACAAS